MKARLLAAARFFTGDIAARALAFATVVVAARLIGPEGFGQFSLAAGAVAVAALLSDLGITPVLVRRQSASNDPHSTAAAFAVNVTCALVLYALLVASLATFDTPLAKIAAVYAAILPIQALESSFEALLLASGRSSRVGSIRFAGNLFLVASAAVLVLAWPSATALAACFVIANLAKLAGGAISSRHLFRTQRPQGEVVRRLLAESWPFFAAALASFLYFRVDVFLVRASLGDHALGLYAAGYRFVDGAILLPGAIAYAFFPGWARNPSGLREAAPVLRLVLGLGLLVAAAAAIAGPWFVRTLLGGAYAESGTVLRILSLGLPFLYVDVILVWIAYALGRERAVICVGAAALGVNLAANAILLPVWGIRGAAAATVVSEVANLAGYLFVLRREIRSRLLGTSISRRLLPAGQAVSP